MLLLVLLGHGRGGLLLFLFGWGLRPEALGEQKPQQPGNDPDHQTQQQRHQEQADQHHHTGDQKLDHNNTSLFRIMPKGEKQSRHQSQHGAAQEHSQRVRLGVRIDRIEGAASSKRVT